MKSLKDQLLKAKLVSKKQVRAVEHQDRIRKKELGRETIEQEKARRKEDLERKELERKEEQRRQQEARRAAEAEAKKEETVLQLATSSNLLEKGFGARRFYFVASNNRIPYLDISEDLAGRLEKGTAAVVELPQGRSPVFYVVADSVAGRLKTLSPEIVRFWNQERGS